MLRSQVLGNREQRVGCSPEDKKDEGYPVQRMCDGTHRTDLLLAGRKLDVKTVLVSLTEFTSRRKGRGRI